MNDTKDMPARTGLHDATAGEALSIADQRSTIVRNTVDAIMARLTNGENASLWWVMASEINSTLLRCGYNQAALSALRERRTP